ncbi:Magnesium transport protein CorA [Stieleria maiorica]|uniref:Magnesium transport protein CorA n=1 Tax=Stieleria maiorica TaxID=2795974 RepID=A0A5B9MAU0_9BACT|nr:magnesium/cobalt transporter CorA [Stieleria maiorica]QEF96635.1 Magnesium transport protein CorA [Stieleria maiorica]
MSPGIFKKQYTRVGARPGTLVISKQSPRPVVRGIFYNPQSVDDHLIEDLDQLPEILKAETVGWIDVQGFGDRSVMNKIGSIFSLHPLLLEDVVNVPQRPKTELYDDQLLIVVRMVRLKDPEEQSRYRVDMEQVSIVLAKNYVITFQERYGDILDPVRKRIKSGKGIIRKRGADYLAYAIADTIVDGYYPVLEGVGNDLEAMEDEVIRNPSPEVLAELNTLKNQLINLRRAVWPQREAVNSLVRGDYSLIGEDVRLYLRDTHDHCIQTSEVAEMYREMATGLMNTYLSSVANRTNDVMKVLTIMASLFIPLTFMAGIYGMNFEHMPELHYQYSYPLLWLVMSLTCVGMLIFFWRKGWIGRG